MAAGATREEAREGVQSQGEAEWAKIEAKVLGIVNLPGPRRNAS